METGIEKAVRLTGNQTALASIVGVTTQAVQKWVAQGLVPAGRCREVEAKLSGSVTRYELNPEVFGSPDEDPSNAIPGRPIDGATVRATTGGTRRVGDYEDRKK
jgi:DNA-binding transcriptional regulator YdaS (Cro superfamily)